MNKWYVLQVLSGKERKTKKSLEEQIEKKGMNDFIEEILLPVENVSEVKDGETKIVEKKLWPGYILVKMNLTDEAWSFIKEVNGIVDFLGSSGKPTALSDDEVAGILRDLKEKKDTVVQKHQFDVGSNVKIIDGVFVNFVGTVIEISPDKGKLSVNVSIFGRDTRVDDLELSQVEEVTDDHS